MLCAVDAEVVVMQRDTRAKSQNWPHFGPREGQEGMADPWSPASAVAFRVQLCPQKPRGQVGALSTHPPSAVSV